MLSKPNSSEPVKFQKARSLERFRSIFEALREKFTVKEIAAMTGIKRNNLSSYASGDKNPGNITLKKFYEKMSDEIKSLPNESHATGAASQSTAKESLGKYGRKKAEQDLLNVVMDQNVFLQGQLDRATTTHQQYVNTNHTQAIAFQTMADSNKQLVDNNKELVSTNNQLVRRILDNLDGDQQFKAK